MAKKRKAARFPSEISCSGGVAAAAPEVLDCCYLTAAVGICTGAPGG